MAKAKKTTKKKKPTKPKRPKKPAFGEIKGPCFIKRNQETGEIRFFTEKEWSDEVFKILKKYCQEHWNDKKEVTFSYLKSVYGWNSADEMFNIIKDNEEDWWLEDLETEWASELIDHKKRDPAFSRMSKKMENFSYYSYSCESFSSDKIKAIESIIPFGTENYIFFFPEECAEPIIFYEEKYSSGKIEALEEEYQQKLIEYEKKLNQYEKDFIAWEKAKNKERLEKLQKEIQELRA